MNNSRSHFLRRWLPFVRVFLGVVFLFSSMVKGIDPVGTSYRVEDYLLIYGWNTLVPYALWIAFLVIFSEFLLGLAFLFRVFIRRAAWGMLAMLAFFTVVTYLDARYNMVPDCGCFGDAVKLTNWQTFYKNVVLMALNLSFLRGIHGEKKTKKGGTAQWSILVIGGGLFLGFMFYNLNHLPVIDFRNWKTGRDMSWIPQKTKTFVLYQNKRTGVKKEFLFPDYPWKDTTWLKQWQFVSQRTVTTGGKAKYNLIIEDSLGHDQTRALVENPGFHLFLVAFTMAGADSNGLKKAAAIGRFLHKRNIPMVLLTASSLNYARKKERQFGLKIPVYQVDETDLKAMIRSNPGLILLHAGVILKKWHYHDFPDSTNLKNIISSSEN